mgnify:CR=1 FL=1
MSAWIAVDWGTTRLRLWALDAAGRVTATATSEEGMARITPEAFEPAFLRAAAGLLPTEGDGPVEVLICGMAGARTGWQEVTYTGVPCAPVTRPEPVTTADPRLRVRIIPGLSQSAPADVMRGEETQIAGVLAEEPGYEGILCLPGTHTKWVRIAAGRVETFRTAMTGELFDLLATRSTLSVFAAGDWDDTAFDAAVAGAVQGPGALAADLFGLRAAALLDGASAAATRARLSGRLIGQEVAALRPMWQDRRVTLVADDMLGDLYHRALSAAGQESERRGAGDLTLAGLRLARDTYPEDRL